jgi:hypothetical protein
MGTACCGRTRPYGKSETRVGESVTMEERGAWVVVVVVVAVVLVPFFFSFFSSAVIIDGSE